MIKWHTQYFIMVKRKLTAKSRVKSTALLSLLLLGLVRSVTSWRQMCIESAAQDDAGLAGNMVTNSSLINLRSPPPFFYTCLWFGQQNTSLLVVICHFLSVYSKLNLETGGNCGFYLMLMTFWMRMDLCFWLSSIPMPPVGHNVLDGGSIFYCRRKWGTKH